MLTVLSVLIYIGTCTTTYAINLFSPTIITQLNPTFTPRETQAHIIPIFLASALFAGLSAYFSDRVRHRYTFVMVGYAISTIGWTVLLCEKLPGVTIGVRYMALYFVGVGSYISLPLLWTLLVNNVHGHYKVAFASGAQIGLGNCGGIVASLIYQSTDAPLYLTGFRVSVGLLAMSAILLTVFVLGLRRENGKRDRGERDWRLREADRDNLGDDHPQFRHVF
jgi:MFS family permease